MTDSLIGFQQKVPDCGYRWVRAARDHHPGSPTEWFVISDRPLGMPVDEDSGRWFNMFATNPPPGSRAYDTRYGRTVFLTFAGLPADCSAIDAFIRTYGLLGGDVREYGWYVDRDSGRGYQIVGERLARWCEEIAAMDEAVEVWKVSRRHERVEWSQGPADEDARAIRRALMEFVDLHGSFPMRLTSFRDKADTRTFSRLTPPSFLAALWLQLRQAIEGDVEYRPCEGPACTTWFVVGEGSDRRHKTHCSALCRKRAQRVPIL